MKMIDNSFVVEKKVIFSLELDSSREKRFKTGCV